MSGASHPASQSDSEKKGSKIYRSKKDNSPESKVRWDMSRKAAINKPS